MTKEKVERALIPYLRTDVPSRAEEEALKRLKRGGELYLLHITDEGPVKSVRYRAGELGEGSELIQNLQEAQKKLQEKAAGECAEEVKMDSAEEGVSIEPLYVAGTPAKEVLKAIEEYSVQLIVIEELREKIAELLWGDTAKYLEEKAPCEVITVE